MLKVILDTNIQISALLSRGGHCEEILRKCIEGELLLCSCNEILNELERVIRYPEIRRKHRLSEEKMKDYIEFQKEFSYLIEIPNNVNLVKAHPPDSIFLLCALEANADYIISGDNHLLGLKSYKSIRIITPKEFLDSLFR